MWTEFVHDLFGFIMWCLMNADLVCRGTKAEKNQEYIDLTKHISQKKPNCVIQTGSIINFNVVYVKQQ